MSHDANHTIKAVAKTKMQMAADYKICVKTFSKWIAPFIDQIGPRQNTYLYTPEQVKKIYELIGEP